MQKTELVKAIADKTGQSQKAVGEVVGALTDIITATSSQVTR